MARAFISAYKYKKEGRDLQGKTTNFLLTAFSFYFILIDYAWMFFSLFWYVFIIQSSPNNTCTPALIWTDNRTCLKNTHIQVTYVFILPSSFFPISYFYIILSLLRWFPPRVSYNMYLCWIRTGFWLAHLIYCKWICLLSFFIWESFLSPFAYVRLYVTWVFQIVFFSCSSGINGSSMGK